eukprot:495824_1
MAQSATRVYGGSLTTIRSSNTGKGFGFINCDDGSGDIYVHHTAIKIPGSFNSFETLNIGDKVKFEIAIQEDGRRRAINVLPIRFHEEAQNNLNDEAKLEGEDKKDFESEQESIVNKKHIQKILTAMQFARGYIDRAFKVYETNYGYAYNIEVITEIIVRLQSKDKEKHKNNEQLAQHQNNDNEKNNISPLNFQTLTLDELNQGKLNSDLLQQRMEEKESDHQNVEDLNSNENSFDESNEIIIEELKQKIEEMKEDEKKMNDETEKLKLKVGNLQDELESLKEFTVNIDILDEQQLDALQLKLQHRINLIKDAKDILIENQLYCMICLKNKKNIVINGCHHFCLCDKCEENLNPKICPRCQTPFSSVIKIGM